MWLDTVVDQRTVLCILDAPPSSGDELLRRVLTDFGLLSREQSAAADVSSVQMTQVLERFLASLRALRAHAFIVIENAQSAADPTREEIHRLARMDPGVLEVLLVGEPSPNRFVTRRRLVTVSVAVAGAAAAVWLWTTRPTTSSAPVHSAAAIAPPSARDAPPADTRAIVPVRNDAVPAYQVQIGAFRDPARADATAARFRELKLPVDAQVTSSGLRQIALGPYVLRQDAAAALTQAKDAGYEGVVVRLPATSGAIDAADRRMLAHAEALAEQHDVRALESLRSAWLDSSIDPARNQSPALAAIDQYLDAARRAQLAADRQSLLQDAARR